MGKSANTPAHCVTKPPAGDKSNFNGDRSTRNASVYCWLKNLARLAALLGFLQMILWAYTAGTRIYSSGQPIQIQTKVSSAGETIQVQTEVASAGQTIQVQTKVASAGETIQVQTKVVSAGEMIQVAGETIQAEAEVASAGETIQAQAEVASAGETIQAQAEVASAGETIQVQPEVASAGETIQAEAEVASAGETIQVQGEVASAGETIQAEGSETIEVEGEVGKKECKCEGIQKLQKLIEGIQKLRKIWGIGEKRSEKRDYASGGWIRSHSNAYYNGLGGTTIWTSSVFGNHPDAEKLLAPGPANCLELLGHSGFVVIQLRSPVIVEAVTIEHLVGGKVFDRMTAPKHCRVYGWAPGWPWRRTRFLLTEFTYEFWKENAQTFKVPDPAIVDSIRLDFTSNHGWSRYTTICGFRVHGREPNSTLT